MWNRLGLVYVRVKAGIRVNVGLKLGLGLVLYIELCGVWVRVLNVCLSDHWGGGGALG